MLFGFWQWIYHLLFTTLIDPGEMQKSKKEKKKIKVKPMQPICACLPLDQSLSPLNRVCIRESNRPRVCQALTWTQNGWGVTPTLDHKSHRCLFLFSHDLAWLLQLDVWATPQNFILFVDTTFVTVVLLDHFTQGFIEVTAIRALFNKGLCFAMQWKLLLKIISCLFGCDRLRGSFTLVWAQNQGQLG